MNITSVKFPVSIKFANLIASSPDGDINRYFFYCFQIVGEDALLVVCLLRSLTQSASFSAGGGRIYTLSKTDDLYNFFVAEKLDMIVVENTTPEELLNYLKLIMPKNAFVQTNYGKQRIQYRILV